MSRLLFLISRWDRLNKKKFAFASRALNFHSGPCPVPVVGGFLLRWRKNLKQMVKSVAIKFFFLPVECAGILSMTTLLFMGKAKEISA